MDERFRGLVAPTDVGDDGSIQWIKQVSISRGVADPRKLKLLGQLMIRLGNAGKRSRMVRQTTLRVIHDTGEHYEKVKVRNADGELEDDRRKLPGVAPHDVFGEVEAVQKWVQRAHYVFDPCAVETFFTPRRALIDIMKGEEGLDCDDLAVLTCAMLGSIGHETAIMVTNPRGPGTPFSHAMAAVKFQKPTKGFYGKHKITYPADRWVALELTIPERVGWVPPKADMFLFFPIDDGEA